MGTLVMEVRSDTPCMMLVAHKPARQRLSERATAEVALAASPSLPDVFLPSRFLMLLRCVAPRCFGAFGIVDGRGRFETP